MVENGRAKGAGPTQKVHPPRLSDEGTAHPRDPIERIACRQQVPGRQKGKTREQDLRFIPAGKTSFFKRVLKSGALCVSDSRTLAPGGIFPKLDEVLGSGGMCVPARWRRWSEVASLDYVRNTIQ